LGVKAAGNAARLGLPLHAAAVRRENQESWYPIWYPKSGRSGAEKAGVQRPPWSDMPEHWVSPGTASRVATTPTTLDLAVLYGGRDRLLRVADVAEQLAIGAWAVYRLCEDVDLPHVRINNAIRVRPGDLSEFIAAYRRASLQLGQRAVDQLNADRALSDR
jgi:hypothetical protein